MVNEIELQNFMSIVDEIRRLYNQAQDAWVELCLRLREIEDSGEWRTGPPEHPEGFSHFGDFMRYALPTVFGPERYRNLLGLIDGYGERLARLLGPGPARALTQDAVMLHPERRGKLIALIEEYIAANGVAPHAETVRSLVHQVTRYESATGPRTARRWDEIQQLRGTVRQLQGVEKKASNATSKLEQAKAEVRQLKSELVKARKRIRALEAELKRCGDAQKRDGTRKDSGGAGKTAASPAQ